MMMRRHPSPFHHGNIPLKSLMNERDPITATYFNQMIEIDGRATIAGVEVDQKLAALLTGAPDYSNVTCETGDGATVFTLEHQTLLFGTAERIVTEENGRLILTNNNLRLNETRNGLGVRMLAHQAYAAMAIGISEIRLFAGAGKDGAGLQLNGMYTWARSGFDAPLKLLLRDRKSCPVDLASISTVREALLAPDGIDWVKTWSSGHEMRFDLKVGSSSWVVFEQYLAEKNIRIGKS
jgi:hypothetical protein